jgi:hypothetical protein
MKREKNNVERNYTYHASKASTCSKDQAEERIRGKLHLQELHNI